MRLPGQSRCSGTLRDHELSIAQEARYLTFAGRGYGCDASCFATYLGEEDPVAGGDSDSDLRFWLILRGKPLGCSCGGRRGEASGNELVPIEGGGRYSIGLKNPATVGWSC